MQWNEARTQFPEQWLVVEVLNGETGSDNVRIIHDVSVHSAHDTWNDAFAAYRTLHRDDPAREQLVAHTQREILSVEVERWIGVRTPSA